MVVKYIVTQALKAAVKKIPKKVKADLPLVGAVGAVETGRHLYNIVKGKKDIHEGTITGITKEIRKAIKKKTKKDKE